MRNGEYRTVVVKVRSARPDSRGLIDCTIGKNSVLLPAAEVEAGDRVPGTHKYLPRNRRLGLQQAIELAVVAHSGQRDKGDNGPYVRHLLRIMEAVAPHGETAMVVGVLHDIVEDTWVNFDYLEELGATREVIDAIDSVTKRKGEPYEDLLCRSRSNRLGKIVKLADNADNSDEARLALLEPERAEYFRNKYAEGRQILLEQ